MRERIMVAGAPGTGKTTAWLTIARMFPKNTFHVIDPDDGVTRVWKSEFKDVDNINYFFTPTWYGKLNKAEFGRTGGVANSFTQIKKEVKPDDWIVIEMLGNLWSMAQTAFVTEIFDQGIGEYFLKARKQMKEGAKRLDALKGWTDWQVINKMHNEDFMIPACFQLPCHVFMTTSVSIVTPSEVSNEEAEQKAFYGDSLIRLDGQKHNPFRAQSIFLFYKKKDSWFAKTFIKDRGREFMDEEIFDFGTQYLNGIAGY